VNKVTAAIDLSPCAYPSRYLAFHYWYIMPVAGVTVSDSMATELEINPGFYGNQWGNNFQGQYQAWHRFYNPTTGRWTTPDPAAQPWTNLLGYVGENPTNRSDPTGLSQVMPGVRVTEAPLDRRECGGFTSTARMELYFPAPCDGYIVQKVDYISFIRNCDHSPGNWPANMPGPIGSEYPLQGTYWEAWPVTRGQTAPDPVPGNAFSTDDVWARPEMFQTYGYHLMTGAVRFYCRRVTGDLGTYGWPPDVANGWAEGLAHDDDDPAKGAIFLPSTSDPNAAAFWNDPFHGGTTYRAVHSSWNCCGAMGGFGFMWPVGTNSLVISETLGTTQPEETTGHSKQLHVSVRESVGTKFAGQGGW